mmetsp:Transcript_63345/g.151132  ORF Transcript_63345/g.151132 Transcript_63345/m.151132 type:complete len:757 (+) Transcript_63345:61-2331(+)
MPLPWSGRKRPTRIDDIAYRAISISQLRSFKTFLQRLTKTELLKQTSEFSKKTGDYGKLIPWWKLNMYNITDEVIKKVIPFIDPDGEHDKRNGGRRWYSWVEFVASEEQPAEIMFSHWWGGCFMDFMQAVNKLTLDRSLSIHTKVWICTFANCQFGEKFGSKLIDCPFIQALKQVDLTVMVVDYAAGSLTRTWCGLEVHYTTQKDKDFVLYTSAGMVGSQYVSGGPLVEAVKAWDIRKSEASDPPYRRQILNYVARVNELEGLQKDESGEMAVDDMGRPSLDGDGTDDHTPPRINGEKEFAYESMLFRKHGKRFEDLNMMVRLRVMAALGVPAKPRGCQLDKITEKGVTLNQIRMMTSKMERTCPWKADDEDLPWVTEELDGLTYSDLTVDHVKEWVKYETEDEGCSYMELSSNGPQKPQYLLTLSESALWSDRMAAIELFAEAHQLPDSAVFFIEVLCVKHSEFERARKLQKLFAELIDECEGIICPLTEAADMEDVSMALGPLVTAMDTDKGVYFASKTGILACSESFRDGSWVHGDFDVQVIYTLLSTILGGEDPDDASDLGAMENKGFRAMVRLHNWLAAPVLRRATRNNDAATIRTVCSLPGLRMNGATMKDNLGRMPLHIAVACQSWDAMHVLLELKMDPNVEDDMKERPLHYCAIRGLTDAAKILLDAGADPWAENSFAESPYEVAKQNPAAFLDVKTEEVRKVLKEAAAPMSHKEAMDIFASFFKQKERKSLAGSGAAAAKQLAEAQP